MKKVLILCNGPGELWGWVRPLERELRSRGYRTQLWLLPCQFSSGRERELAGTFMGHDIKGPFGSPCTLMEMRKAEGDIVVQLGGDLMFGRYLAGTLKIPLVCYSYGPKKGMNRCNAVLTAFEWMAARITRKTGCAVKTVGDLTLDSMKMDHSPDPWQPGKGLRLVLFPGSRPGIRERAMTYMQELIGFLSSRVPGLQVRTPFLPDIHEEEMRNWQRAGLNPVTCGTAAVLRGASIALTQPGTNNFEIMHSGTPGVIALPFEFLDVIPLSGLKGMLTSLPLAGPWAKKILLRRMDRYTGFLSWPNRMAGKEIFREFRGDFNPVELGHMVLPVLFDEERLEKQRQQLLALSSCSPDHASLNICEVLERLI